MHCLHGNKLCELAVDPNWDFSLAEVVIHWVMLAIFVMALSGASNQSQYQTPSDEGYGWESSKHCKNVK